MDRVERPLSPHVTLYRWQIPNTLSILHRGTGLYLSLGAFALVWWLMSLAGGADAYDASRGFFGSVLFRLLALGWVFCFFYHLANGLRHLCWDAGFGFEPHQYRASGWAVVVFAVVATLLYAFVALL